MGRFEIRAIGHMRTPWHSKFGVPRQPGFIRAAVGEVVFEEEFAGREAREGLEGFSHLWVTFVFDQVREEETRLRVRPPRLGGNEKAGVFATRSPYRPNRLGLSLLEIAEVWPRLLLRGVDLVDSTPVVDLRPYIPFVESVPDARGGFAEEVPGRLTVGIGEGAKDAWASLEQHERDLLSGMLACDPRPAYQREEEGRGYAVEVGHWRVRWEVRQGVGWVTGLERCGV